jgi:hypothetical protein
MVLHEMMTRHTDWTGLGRLLALALPGLLVGCAMSSDARIARMGRQVSRATTALERRTDADSLAAAGLLESSRHRDKALSLVAQAAEVSPDRADLVWLHIAICQKTPPCDPENAERRLRSLDASNGVGWLGALSKANAQNNDAAKDAALTEIGKTARVDIYWTTLIAHLSKAIADTKALSLPDAEVTVIGVLAAQAIPAYGVASNSCKGERLQRADILEACRAVASAFEHGDTYITEMIGVAIAKRVWPENSPEWAAATEARRNYEYRSKFWGKLDIIPWSKSAAEKYLGYCEQNHREQDVLRAQLVAAGANPSPPAEKGGGG